MDLSLRNIARTLIATTTLTLLSAVLLCGSAIGQDAEVPGMKELDKAFDKKINSTSTRDLDEVARLCEQAIKKGLTGDAAEQAKMLAKTAYYEHADQLANRIFTMTSATDPRWQRMRREALRRLEKTVKLDPDMASAYVLMARLNSLPRGDTDEGMAAAQKAIKLIEDDDELMAQALMAKVALTLADVKKPDNVVDEIMEDIDRAIELDPNNEQARFLRSKLLARDGKIAESLADLDAALANTKNADAYKLEANRLIANKQFPDSPEMQAAALRYLDKAMELKPEPKLLLTKAIVYQVMKKPEEALAAIDGHLKDQPDNVKAFLLRAGLNAEEENLDAAIADLTKASEIEPDELSIYLNRIRLHELNKDIDSAIADCKMVLDKNLSENKYEFQITLARLYLRAERPRSAAKVATEILKDYEDGVWEDKRDLVGFQEAMRRLDTLRLRAGAYLNAGEHKKSIEDYELAVDMTDIIFDLQQQIAPRMRIKMDDYEGDPGILNNLAWALATSTVDELRDGDRAIVLAEKAADLTDYKEAYILSTLASAYAEVGDFERAIQWSEKAVKRNQEEMEEIEDDQEMDEKVKEETLKASAEQLESLKKELASYEDGKPWRELQTTDEEDDQEEEQDKDLAKDDGDDSDDTDDQDAVDNDAAVDDDAQDDAPSEDMKEQPNSDDGDAEEDSAEQDNDEEPETDESKGEDAEKSDEDEIENGKDNKEDEQTDEDTDSAK
jgi:predicted Zn-dependent protease